MCGGGGGGGLRDCYIMSSTLYTSLICFLCVAGNTKGNLGGGGNIAKRQFLILYMHYYS